MSFPCYETFYFLASDICTKKKKKSQSDANEGQQETEYKQIPQKNQMCLKMALLQDKACHVALSNTSYCLIKGKQKQLSQPVFSGNSSDEANTVELVWKLSNLKIMYKVKIGSLESCCVSIFWPCAGQVSALCQCQLEELWGCEQGNICGGSPKRDF